MTPQQENELLDCPMCGCAATYVKHSAGIPGTQGFDKWDAVACKHCRTTVGACDRRFRNRDDASAAWNRRAPAPTEPAVDRDAVIAGWDDALAEVRATVGEMQNNLEAFGEYSQETARCVLDGVLDAIDEIIAEPIEIAVPQDYALVPVRVTQAMRAAWDATPSNEDDDVEFSHAYQRMIAASVPPTIPRWDQLVEWKTDRQAAILMVEGLKSENALLRAALATPASPAVPGDTITLYRLTGQAAADMEARQHEIHEAVEGAAVQAVLEPAPLAPSADIRDEVAAVMRGAGFDVRPGTGFVEVSGTLDSAAILIEQLLTPAQADGGNQVCDYCEGACGWGFGEDADGCTACNGTGQVAQASQPTSAEELQQKEHIPPCAEPASPVLDEVVEANRALLHQRSQLGIKKYGGTLGDLNHPRRVLLQHALEEALDLANYLQADIQAIDRAGTGKDTDKEAAK